MKALKIFFLAMLTTLMVTGCCSNKNTDASASESHTPTQAELDVAK